MPFILAPVVTKDMPGLWAEGSPYSTDIIYDICAPAALGPPVQYDSHTLKPHSMCHFDAPGHIIPGGETIDDLYKNHLDYFFGPVLVIKLNTRNFILNLNTKIFHWEVKKAELELALSPYLKDGVEKLFMSFKDAESNFYSNSTHALTLSEEAAVWLTSLPRFNLFGTIWKSTDYCPGSRERPIHKELFKSAGIIECLDLSKVPEGRYFLCAFPIPTFGATESPVCPVLFSENEIHWK